MNTESWSDWIAPGGGRRGFKVGLDDRDGRRIVGEKWDQLPPSQQLEWLEKRCDLEVLQYMWREGAITEEFFQQRVNEVRMRGRETAST